MANLSFEPSYPFEATLETDGKLHLNGLPDDQAVQSKVVQVIAQSQPFGEAWEAAYRTQYLLSGAAPDSVATLEAVQGIQVPHWRRFQGEVRGSEVTISTGQLSSDGEAWQPFPAVDDTQAEFRHPAFHLTGEVVGQFFTLHWREGRIDIEPDPPGDMLELLESVAQAMNGDGNAAWKERHTAIGGPANVLPDAKRCTFEVRKLAPLFSPSNPPFARLYGLEFWPLVPLEYSADGKKWAKYPIEADVLPETAAVPAQGQQEQDDPMKALSALFSGESGGSEDDDDGEDPFGMLSSLFEMHATPVTVHADGRVEWAEGDIDAEHAEALRQSLLRTTGAGDAAAWGERMTELSPEGGVPAAVRMQVMKQLLSAAPGMLDQSYAPTAVSLDGVNWVDLDPMFGLMDDDEDDENDTNGVTHG